MPQSRGWVWAERFVSVVLVALCVWVFSIGVHTSYIVNDKKDQKQAAGIPLTVKMPSDTVTGLIRSDAELLSEWCKELVEDGIEMWACFGTALGIARNGGRIPWDDDIDMGFWESDWERLKRKITEKGFHHEFTPVYTWCGCKLMAADGHEITDLFPFMRRDDGMAVLAWSGWQRTQFTKQSMFDPDTDAYPIRSAPYDDTTLPVLARNTALQTKWFGESAFEEARVSPPHSVEGIVMTTLNPALTWRFELRDKGPHDHDPE